MDYNGKSRSNYVHFTDVEKVKAILAFYGCVLISNEKGDAILLNGSNDTGDKESTLYGVDEETMTKLTELGLVGADDENEGDVELPDFMETLAEYLPDGEVLIWTHIGSEGNKYMNGYALAINNQGQTRGVELTDIYSLAKELGTTVTEPSY